MQATIKTVNAAGLRQIAAEILARTGQELTASQVQAWAADAEYQLGEGNPAVIEISATGTLSGHTETFTVSDAGLDVETIEIDE